MSRKNTEMLRKYLELLYSTINVWNVARHTVDFSKINRWLHVINDKIH